MYTPREPPGRNVFKVSLRIEPIDVILYLSAADKRADTVDKQVGFGSLVSG